MKKRGFTLIEMLIVIVIIGILAGALIPRIGTARDKANDTAREANVRSLATAIVSYGLDHGSYKDGIEEMDLTKYSIPSNNFKGQPTSKDNYQYRRLDGGSHFVVYAMLSEGSEAGNCNLNEATTTETGCDTKKDTWTEDVATHTSANCSGGFQAATTVTGLAAALTTYDLVNGAITTTGNGFCYLQ